MIVCAWNFSLFLQHHGILICTICIITNYETVAHTNLSIHRKRTNGRVTVCCFSVVCACVCMRHPSCFLQAHTKRRINFGLLCSFACKITDMCTYMNVCQSPNQTMILLLFYYFAWFSPTPSLISSSSCDYYLPLTKTAILFGTDHIHTHHS